ncbi:MAG: UDP-N-acetylmuramoyl-L-alanine--D-glutamate ligase [Hyphomicrobiaceae bacterium]
MIAVTTFAGRRVAVFGLARSGLAAAHALRAGGAQVIGWDDGERGRETAADEGIELADLRLLDWSALSALVLAPGVPLTHPEPHWTVRQAQRAGVEIIGDTELFFRERRALAARARVIAITGTNGKSTTAALVAHLLKQAGCKVSLGGNIGEAILGLEPLEDDRAYVIEFSSYQIDLTPSLEANAAALLNITPDHLDRHGTLQNYAAVKARIFANLGPGDTAVCSIDDTHCRAIAAALAERRTVEKVSIEGPVDRGVYCDDMLIEVRDGVQIPRVALGQYATLPGRHNRQNAAAAWALLRSLGVEPAAIARGLASFPGLAHRMELVGQVGRVLFVNDSKATNAEAAGHALDAYDRIYWIAGGLAKEGGIETLTPQFSRLAKAYLVGEAAEPFATTLGAVVPHETSGTIAAAVSAAARDASRDDHPRAVVLLSPACASFDQFPDFEARGDAFKAAVAGLDGVVLGTGGVQ